MLFDENTKDHSDKTNPAKFNKYNIRNIIVIVTKQKHPGCKKSARPIRSSIANRYVRPKTLIAVEAKKLLINNLFNYLNDILAYFHNYDWICHLATFFVPSLLYKGGQVIYKANHSCENML